MYNCVRPKWVLWYLFDEVIKCYWFEHLSNIFSCRFLPYWNGRASFFKSLSSHCSYPTSREVFLLLVQCATFDERFVVDLLAGVGKVGEANTSDGSRCVVGAEAISMCQVCICADDHRRRSSVHVQTSISCSQQQHRRQSHVWLWRISSCMCFIMT